MLHSIIDAHPVLLFSVRTMRVIHLISLLLLLGIQIPNSEAFVTRPTSQHITAQDHDVFSISAVASSNEEVSKIQQWSVDELEEQALKSRVVISFTTLGPGFRAVARAKHNETLIMGYVEGFLRPSGVILHLDKMEVFKKMVKRVRNEDPAMDFGGVSFAIGLLLGYRCLLHGVENGCSSAEFLAIDDEGMFPRDIFHIAL